MAKQTSAKMETNHSQHQVPLTGSSKPTTPGIQAQRTAAPPATMPDPCPLHAGRVWNKARPKKAVTSTLKKFDDGGVHAYRQKPKFAPGVPNNEMTRKGYVGPDARPGKSRGGSGDITTDGSYPPGGHTSYGAS